MDQLSKSRKNTHPQQCHCLPAPRFFRGFKIKIPKISLDHAGQTQDLPKIHLSTSTPPSKTTTGPLSSCLLKRNQKNTIWRKGSSHYLTTCTMSPAFSTRPCRTNPRLAKDSPFNFHPPPSKTTTGPLSSCLLKRNRKDTIWRKGSSHYLTTCTMSPTFSTRPCRTNPRLAKDSHLNFHPPLQNNHGSFVILSSQKRNQKTPFFICLHYFATCTTSATLFNWSMQEKSKTCQRFTPCTFLSMEYVDPY